MIDLPIEVLQGALCACTCPNFLLAMVQLHAAESLALVNFTLLHFSALVLKSYKRPHLQTCTKLSCTKLDVEAGELLSWTNVSSANMTIGLVDLHSFFL